MNKLILTTLTLLTSLGLAAYTPMPSQATAGDFNYEGFIVDLCCYEMHNTTGGHAGDLYDHVVWTAGVVESWFETENYWTEGLTKADMPFAVLCAFFHDLGKMGDTATKYRFKYGHPHTGLEYVQGTKQFFRAVQSPEGSDLFPLQKYLQQLGFSREQMQIIAIVNSMHWDLGGVLLKGFARGRDIKQLCAIFMHKLCGLVKEVGYRDGRVDRKLLELILLISAADMRANAQFYYQSKILPKNLPPTKVRFAGRISHYEEFNVERAGRIARAALFDYFDNEYLEQA